VAASAVSAAVLFTIGGLASLCLLWGLWSRGQIRRALDESGPKF
jgi:hypothetical protein